MSGIFRDMLDQFMVVYLDDILIYSDTPQQQSTHARQVLQ